MPAADISNCMVQATNSANILEIVHIVAHKPAFKNSQVPESAVSPAWHFLSHSVEEYPVPVEVNC